MTLKNILSTREYERILAAYIRPDALLATRPDSASTTTFEGSAADLRHNVWLVSTDDPSKKRNPERILAFDQVIDVRGVRISDRVHLHDNLSLKIWMLETMRGQYLPQQTASHLASLFLAAIWVLRWRTSLPIQRFSEVSEPLFEDFCCRLKTGAMGLVPWEERLAAFCDEVSDGSREWPISTSGNRIRTDSTALAEALGLTIKVAMVERTYVAAVRAAAGRLASLGNLSAAAKEDDVLSEESSEERALTPGSVRRYLRFWSDFRHLSSLGIIAHDPLPFDPFRSVTMDERTLHIGPAGRGRTKTLASEQWVRLLDAAARWVLDYSSPILRVCEGAMAVERECATMSAAGRKYRIRPVVTRLIEEHFPAKPGRPTLLPIWYRSGGASVAEVTGVALNEAVRMIVAACIILIGGLTARRVGELDSLQVGCGTKDEFGNLWMSSYIEKTVRDIDQIPAPAMVGVAIALLEQLSASGRQRTGEPWLANIDRPNTELGRFTERVGYKLTWRTLLNEFAAINGLIDKNDNDGWRYSPHQLRRAFAIYYFHGNRFANLDALSRFLRHYDPEVTRLYIEEISGGRLGQLSEIAKAHARKAEGLEAAAKRSSSAAMEARAALAVAQDARSADQSIRDRRGEFEDVRQMTQTERILEVYDGEEEPIGYGAAGLHDDLEELVEKARLHVRLERPSANGSPAEVREALPALLAEYVKTHYLEPVSGGFAHCRCRPGVAADLRAAVCLISKAARTGSANDQRPDSAYASIEVCLGSCPHGLALSENERVVSDAISRGRDAAKSRPAVLVDGIVAAITSAQAAVAGRQREGA